MPRCDEGCGPGLRPPQPVPLAASGAAFWRRSYVAQRVRDLDRGPAQFGIAESLGKRDGVVMCVARGRAY